MLSYLRAFSFWRKDRFMYETDMIATVMKTVCYHNINTDF